jgi:hypothetical protein
MKKRKTPRAASSEKRLQAWERRQRELDFHRRIAGGPVSIFYGSRQPKENLQSQKPEIPSQEE